MSTAGPALGLTWMQGHPEARHNQLDMNKVVHDPAGDDCPPEVVQRLKAPAQGNTQVMRNGTIKRLPRSQQGGTDWASVTLGKRAVGNNPEDHLWSEASRAAGARRRRCNTALMYQGTAVDVLPLPSPVRRSEWWQRPPSPLVWYMRPLWAVPFEEERESPERRAPEDGEQPSKPSISEQMSNESCTPLGSALSLLSQEMTFFAREQARARRGSWSSSLLESLSPSFLPTAPPPPTTDAPTIPMAMSAGAERRRQLQLQQQQQLQQPQSPDGSPESTRPPTGRRTPSAPSSSVPDSTALLITSAFSQPKDQYQLSYLKQQQQQQQGFPPARSPEGGGDTAVVSRSRPGGDRGSGSHSTTFLNSYAVNNSGKGVMARPKAVALLARRRSLELRLAENAGPPEKVNSSRVVLHRSASVGDIKNVKKEVRATLRRSTSTARYSYPQLGDVATQQNRAVQFALPELRGDVVTAASKGSKVEEKVTGIRILEGIPDKGNGSQKPVGDKAGTLGYSPPDDSDEAPALDKLAGDPEDHVGKLKLDDDGDGAAVDGEGDNNDEDDDHPHQRRNSVGLVGVAYARSPAMMAPPPPQAGKGTSRGGAGTRKHSRRSSVAVSHKYHQYEHGLAFLSDGSSEAPSMGLISGGTTPIFAASVAAAATSAAEMGAATEDSSEQTLSAPESSSREDEADEGTELSPSSSAVDSNVGSTVKAPSRQESSVYNPVSPSSLHGIQRSGSFHTPTPSRRRKKAGADLASGSPGTEVPHRRRGAPARKLSRDASGRRVKTKERRSGKGTAASRGDPLGNSSQQSSKRRGTVPSAESPFNVGSPSVRVGSRRRLKVGHGSPGFAGGFVPALGDGVGADGKLDGSKPRSVVSRELDGRNIAPGPSRSGSGRIGGGSGGLGGSRSSISRREPSGKGLFGDDIDQLAGKEDEGVEGVVHHYVNPMKVQGEHRKQLFSPTMSSNRISRGSSTRAEGGDDLGTSKGAFSKLLRRLSILRRRWRQTRRQKEASKGFYGTSMKGKKGGDGVDKFDAAVETLRGGKGKGNKDVRSLTEVDADLEEMAVDKEELEMACRRLLDGLWMSAKRGTGTVSLSVDDGRTLLLGLMTPGGPADRAGISFGVPLSRPGSASRPSSGSCKPSRPILGGGAGPFVKAARSNNTAGDAIKPRLGAQADRRKAELGLSPQWYHGQLANLQRAMETAMGVATDGGVSSETESFSEQADTKDYTGEWSTGSQQLQPPDPSASRRHGRHTSSRANLHRKMGSVFTGYPLGIMGPGSRRLEGGSDEIVGPGRDPGRRESARSQSLPPKDTSDPGMGGGYISAGGQGERGAEDGRRRQAQYHSEQQHHRRRSSLPKHVGDGTTPSYEDLKREAGGRSGRGRKAERSRDSSRDGVRERSRTG